MTPTPTPMPVLTIPSPDPFIATVTWDGLFTTAGAIIAAVIAALIAVGVYSYQQKAARRAQQASIYAESIRAVADYLEAPYRIRRRDGSATARMATTDHISEIQSRISYHQSLLKIHAPAGVAAAYDDLVRAARNEAGPQMTAAWRMKPTRRDRDVPLRSGERYSHPATDAAMVRLRALMKD